MQGGRKALDLGQAFLWSRVRAIAKAEDVAAELFQHAASEIMEGKGYPWDIPLNVSQALKRARGPGYGDEAWGSDHRIFDPDTGL